METVLIGLFLAVCFQAWLGNRLVNLAMLVNISLKFHKDVLKGFNVIERTQFCH